MGHVAHVCMTCVHRFLSLGSAPNESAMIRRRRQTILVSHFFLLLYAAGLLAIVSWDADRISFHMRAVITAMSAFAVVAVAVEFCVVHFVKSKHVAVSLLVSGLPAPVALSCIMQYVTGVFLRLFDFVSWRIV